MKTKNILIILIICIPALLLSGCIDDMDEEILGLIVEAWAEHNGLIKDGKVSPIPIVQKVAEDTIRDVTNDEPFIQLDGLEVIRDIEKADEIARIAISTRNTAKMADAINIRPNDWRLREQDAMLWMNANNSAAAQSAIDKSDDLLKDQVQGGNCLDLRIQQLEYRSDILLKEIRVCEDDSKSCDKTTMEEIQNNTQLELQGIYSTNASPFCD